MTHEPPPPDVRTAIESCDYPGQAAEKLAEMRGIDFIAAYALVERWTDAVCTTDAAGSIHKGILEGFELRPQILPDWGDLRGVAPGATGDMSSEDFVRNLRAEWPES